MGSDQRGGAARRARRRCGGWVAKILACAPLSVQAIKQVVRATGSMTAIEAQALRLPALVAALQSEDSQEGVLAFREKRKPVWQGR
jgi:crotonobetainyl-CoA hydratase